jgi:hypothetical protein
LQNLAFRGLISRCYLVVKDPMRIEIGSQV